MIEYIKKNITTVKSGMVLHGVNCSGVAFASGVAGAIRKKWPEAYNMYKDLGGGKFLLGTTNFIVSINSSVIIANGYTQVNYGKDGKKYADIDAVEKCIICALEAADAFEKPLYMPKIGCGLGGLSWKDEVEPVLLKASLEFPDVNIFICEL